MPNLTKKSVLRGPKRKRRGPARSRLAMETNVLVASNYWVSNIHDVTQDIKQQLLFLKDLDKMEKKRYEEAEKKLIRAA